MPTLMLAMLTWTTWGRTPLVKPGHAAALAGLLPKLAEKGRAELTELAVVSNHVHTILRIGPRCDLSRLVQYLKGGSALLLNRLMVGHARIRWAEGYDLRSVDLRSLPQLRQYLDNQGRHHGVPLLVRWSMVKVGEELRQSGVVSLQGSLQSAVGRVGHRVGLDEPARVRDGSIQRPRCRK